MNLKFKQIIKIIILPALCAVFTAQAHHSLVGEFDTSVNFELRGEITEVEWTNPHIWLYLSASIDDEEAEPWECEMGSPNQLFRLGWVKEDLPPGTIILAQANRARDGTNTCSTRNITLEDGTPVFSRSGNR